MKFIKLTRYSIEENTRDNIYMRCDSIEYIHHFINVNDKTHLASVINGHIKVVETPEQILEMIREINAEKINQKDGPGGGGGATYEYYR